MKKILAEAIISSLLVVSALMIAVRFVVSDMLFYLLYPGLMLGLLITGGHGGTVFEDRIAAIVGFLVNLLVYTLVLSIAISIWRRTRARGAESPTR